VEKNILLLQGTWVTLTRGNKNEFFNNQ